MVALPQSLSHSNPCDQADLLSTHTIRSDARVRSRHQHWSRLPQIIFLRRRLFILERRTLRCWQRRRRDGFRPARGEVACVVVMAVLWPHPKRPSKVPVSANTRREPQHAFIMGGTQPHTWEKCQETAVAWTKYRTASTVRQTSTHTGTTEARTRLSRIE